MGFFNFTNEGTTVPEEEKLANQTAINEDEAELSEEGEAAVKEAAQLITGITAYFESFKQTEDYAKAVNEGFIQEKTIVKLDKEAKLARLQKIAVLQLAKDGGDKLFTKYHNCKKMERFLEDKLEAKYGNKAKGIAVKALKSAGKK